MFTCLYSIWDWLEAPPVFTANMESKKLQQLQQANSHLAPQKKMPLAYQTTVGDYRTATHSPVFQQNLLQYHQSNVNIPNYQSPTSSGSQITPVDIQPHTHMLLKSNAQSQYQQQQYGSIGGEQLYQSPTSDRYYQMAPRNQNQALAPLGNHQHSHPVTALQAQYQQLQQAKMQAQIQTQNEAIVQQQRTFAMRQQLNPPVPQSHFHMSQSSSMMSSPIQNQQQQQQQQKQQQQQYQQQLQQQHQQNQQQLQSTTQLQSNAHHRIAAPPSTLNLSSQFQPAQGPLKINNNNNEARVHHQQQQQQQQQHQQHYQDTLNQSIYQQQQQQLPQKQHAQQHPPVQTKFHSGKVDTSVSSGLTGGINEPSPVYIQQNHPGHVVNQACQTQISGAAGNKTKTPSSEEGSSVKSPAHESPSHQQLDRKKSSGSVQALKLPLTKRPPSSPVTISGWLYKQGSEGLKVWRKRWFVLSEYCLYYYKGPEEEKVLGAILLPSYRISACLPEDKIYRKFAFKCEHTNMRTYWLAAENCETMIQWVKALTAAALMQASSESSDQTSQPSVSSLNHSGENSDSGIHTFHSQQGKMGISGVAQGPVTPASDNGAQPLYANAPPKPRRINDGGYSSPSPENSIERADKIGLERQQILSQQQLSRRSGGVMSPTLQQMQRSQQHAIYDTQTGNVTSTVRTNDPLTGQFHQMSLDGQKKSPFYMTEYGKHVSAYNQALELEEQLIRSQSQRLGEELYGERELYMQKIIQQRYPNQIGHGGVMTYPNAERRTPDAYGRSKNKSLSDYEDIYNVAQQTKLAQAQQPTSAELGAYRRPMSPPTYDSTKHVPPMPSRYTPNHLEPSPSHVSLRSRPSVASISRPHSADFLEYEARAEAAAAAAIKPDPIRAPRPKSSLDINRTPDSYYYSEASYAEKMRQSALYLQKPQSQQPQQQQPPTTPSGGSSYNRSHDVSPYLNGTNNGGMNTIGYENPYERIHKRHELLNETLNHGAQSVPRMSRSTTNTSIQSVGSGGNNSHPKEYQHRSQYMQSNEQFLRSASARLPKRGDDDTNTISIAGNAGSPSNTIDGERKREESMKRLLEWKQRMLQSPLTRKGIQQPGSASVMAKLGSNPNILIGSGSGIQRSRSETHANAGGGGYTSYSSDDEDGPPDNSPAGRSSPTPPSSSNKIIDKSAIKSITSTTTIHSVNKVQNVLELPKKKCITKKCPDSQISNINEIIILQDTLTPLSSRKCTSSLNSSIDLSTCLLETETYVPVYKPKVLPSMVTKNYENVVITDESKNDLATDEIIVKDNTSVNVQIPTVDCNLKDISRLKASSVQIVQNVDHSDNEIDVKLITPNPDSDFNANNKEVDEDKNDDIDDVAVDNDNDNENDEDDDDEKFEYTDDDLDEALAENDEIKNYEISEQPNLVIDSIIEQVYENEPQTPTNQSENHYLPMTPKKSILSPTSSLTFMSSIHDDEEENPYVEMTKGIDDNMSKSNYEVVCISENFTTVSEPLYMELTQGKPNVDEKAQAEESPGSGKSTLKKSTLKKSSDALKKKSKKSSERNQIKRKDLPDILKASQNTVMNSDSSDADDESTKDNDIYKMRSRTRFSLSDTFRPASYYLGASTPLANCAESSDSEIVSPPPIPSSPPPMEELNTEEIFSSENYDTVKRRDKLNLSFDQIPKIHSSNSSPSLNKSEGYKSSRLSLPDQFSTKLRNFKPNILKNHESTLSDSNYSFQTDNSSNTSSDFDLYNKLKNNSPSFACKGLQYQSNSSLPQKFLTGTVTGGDSSETDSVEFRHRQGSDSELERQRSRRPLSEESISEIESMSEHFEETLTTTDLDSYLSRLQTSDLYLYQNSDTNLILNDATGIITNLIKPPEIFRNEGDDHCYGNINFVSSTDSLQKMGKNPYSSKEEIIIDDANLCENTAAIRMEDSMLKEKNLSLHNAQCESETLSSIEMAKSCTVSSVDMDQTSFCTAFDLTQITPFHSRNNSNISEQSAPYYYSDLNAREVELLDNSNPNEKNPISIPLIQLNNQREMNTLTRSNAGISHIHNPLSIKNPLIDNLSRTSKRSMSVEILTDKCQTIDSKNLNKMKPNIEKLSYCTNKNLKSNIAHSEDSNVSIENDESIECCSNKLISPSSLNAQQLQAHHLQLLQQQQQQHHHQQQQQQQQHHHLHHRSPSSLSSQSRKLTNTPSPHSFISSKCTNLDSNSCSRSIMMTKERNHNPSPCSSTSCNNESKLSDLSAGEQLWEEDALWRESLRRVSQRHARSLDDLDRIGPIASSEQIKQLTKSRISRDVTYVNDNVSQHLRSNYNRSRLSDRGGGASEEQEESSEKRTENDENDENNWPSDRNENDVYVQLAVDDINSDVYEVLREDSGGSNYSRKSSEIDRETIRQWDSMSSGLMKNTSNSTKTTINSITTAKCKPNSKSTNNLCELSGNNGANSKSKSNNSSTICSQHIISTTASDNGDGYNINNNTN